MPTFSYKALQTDGRWPRAQLEPPAGPTRLRQMESARPAPGEPRGKGRRKKRCRFKKRRRPVRPAWKASETFPSSSQSQKVSAKELENFTRLLSSLLAAGVPLSRALVILHKEASSPAAQAKWKEIHDLVVDGMSLADAMAKSPETFPRVYVAMVEAGEAGGFLDVVLAQIAEFQAREKELKSKVLTAMIVSVHSARAGAGAC